MTSLTTSSIGELSRQLGDKAQPLPDLGNPHAFAAHFDVFADAKIVLLGEASHGTAEFYKARAAITQRLVERHGFRILALEADWPDAVELDRFIRQHGVWGEHSAFTHFPRWMWRNMEFADFLKAMRGWNEERSAHDRLELRGLDVYTCIARATRSSAISIGSIREKPRRRGAAIRP